MFPSPSILLNCRRPAEQEKQRAKQSILVFISFVSLLFSAFLLVRFFSAGCRSDGRFSVGSGAASVGATGGRRTAVGRWRSWKAEACSCGAYRCWGGRGRHCWGCWSCGEGEAEVKICLRRGSWLGVCCERLEEQRRKERRTDLGPWGVLLGCYCSGRKRLWCRVRGSGWERGEAVRLREKKKNQKGLFGLFLARRRTNEREGGAAGREEKKSELGAAAAPLEKISLGHF